MAKPSARWARRVRFSSGCSARECRSACGTYRSRSGEPCRTRFTRVKCALFPALLVILSVAGGQRRTVQGQSSPAEASPGMDQAIALLGDARRQFQNVRDYECRLIKRERVNGLLLPESVMTMRVLNQPFSVYLCCEEPASDKGLEVSYVAGRDRDMMRVHPVGLIGVLGFFSLDPRDPRALEKNRHCITEAGLGHLLESTARYWDTERRLSKTLVRITEEELDGRLCTRIETIHPESNVGPFYGYRCVLWLDKATHLPAGSATYDWPRPGGPVGGDLLEHYRFAGLRCNIGLDDTAFPR